MNKILHQLEEPVLSNTKTDSTTLPTTHTTKPQTNSNSQNEAYMKSHDTQTKATVSKTDSPQTNWTSQLKGQLSARLQKTDFGGSYSVPNSPGSVRHKVRNIEEAVLQDKYLKTLEQKQAFHKKGYFNEFATQNKILSDQYKVEQSPQKGHSRYKSKPVFFTTLDSKNKLSRLASVDHSELLEVTRHNFSKSFRPMNTISQFNNEDSTRNNDSRNETKTNCKSNLLPTIRKRELARKNFSHDFNTTEASINSTTSPKNQLKLTFKTTGNNDIDLSRTTHNFLTFTSTASKSPKNFLDDVDNTRRVKPGKHQAILVRLKNPNGVKEITRYHTEDLTKVLMHEMAETSKIGTDEYLEHNRTIDNKRDATITATVTKDDLRFTRDNSGGIKPYYEVTKAEKYKEVGALDQIGKFEENLQGWIKGVPNFGKQRWAYDKNWEFQLS